MAAARRSTTTESHGPALTTPFRLPLIAILRGITPDETSAHVRALVEEGYDAIEIPTNSPDWQDSVAIAAREFSVDARIGAGTVLTLAHVDALVDAGGTLAVTPEHQPGGDPPRGRARPAGRRRLRDPERSLRRARCRRAAAEAVPRLHLRPGHGARPAQRAAACPPIRRRWRHARHASRIPLRRLRGRRHRRRTLQARPIGRRDAHHARAFRQAYLDHAA